MALERVRQSSSQKAAAVQSPSRLAARPLVVQAQQNLPEPVAEKKTANRDSEQSIEQAARFGHHFADIPIQPLDALSSASIQRKRLNNDESAATAEQRPNQTGLPDHLKAGIENLSGFSLDNVKVHYNSARPAQVNALAYTQGTEIHVAPGQERHLAHEAWHVVQQAQGRVKPTMQMKVGVLVNDDARLEQEAETIGDRADDAGRDTKSSARSDRFSIIPASNQKSETAQGYWKVNHQEKVAGWAKEVRERPPYSPLGYTWHDPPANNWETLPNHHVGETLVHTPHQDDEEQKNPVYGGSMEAKDPDKCPPVDAEVVFLTKPPFSGTVLSVHKGGGYKSNKPFIKLGGTRGVMNRGVSAWPGEWFYETKLQSQIVKKEEPEELKDIIFGFNKLYYNPKTFSFSIKKESDEYHEIAGLVEFGKATGGLWYNEWGQYSFEKPDTKLPGKGKIEKMKAAMNAASVIRFNLDGFTDVGERSVAKEFTSPEIASEVRMGNFTIGELYAVVSNERLLAKTTFYLRGEAISHEDAEWYLGIKFQNYKR